MSEKIKAGDLIQVQFGKLSIWDKSQFVTFLGWVDRNAIMLYIGYPSLTQAELNYYHPVILEDRLVFLEFRKTQLQKFNEDY